MAVVRGAATLHSVALAERLNWLVAGDSAGTVALFDVKGIVWDREELRRAFPTTAVFRELASGPALPAEEHQKLAVPGIPFVGGNG